MDLHARGTPRETDPQQASLEVKRCNAERLRDEEGVPFPIVVDAFEGTIHQLYGPAFNNAVFLINKAGIIVYRTMFLDASALAEPLADLVEWQWMDADNRVIKKSYSEQIRMVREPYDPECQQRILKVLEATNGPLDFEQMRAQRGFDLRDWRRSGG